MLLGPAIDISICSIYPGFSEPSVKSWHTPLLLRGLQSAQTTNLVLGNTVNPYPLSV